MSKTGPWYDTPQKREAILKVLRHIVEHPEKGLACIGNDANAHALFKNIGGIAVPEAEGGRAIVFASGELKLEAGSSVIIELPPPSMTPGSNPSDTDLLAFVIGNYIHWLD